MISLSPRHAGSWHHRAEIPLAATVAAMDQAQVNFGLLSAWRGPHGDELISNDEVAEWMGARPDRFAGLGTVDLARPMDAVRGLRRCVTELGFRGWRVAGLRDRTPDPVHRPDRAGLSRADDRVWPRRLPLDRRDDRRDPQTRQRLHRHFGLHQRAPAQELIAFLGTSTGSRKVLFGTNYPMINHAYALADLDHLGLDTEARRLYLHENAARVFGLTVPSTGDQ